LRASFLFLKLDRCHSIFRSSRKQNRWKNIVNIAKRQSNHFVPRQLKQPIIYWIIADNPPDYPVPADGLSFGTLVAPVRFPILKVARRMTAFLMCSIELNILTIRVLATSDLKACSVVDLLRQS
jgi:hypothetical protein